MKRKEISEYLDELLDVAGDIDMSINIVGDGQGERPDRHAGPGPCGVDPDVLHRPP